MTRSIEDRLMTGDADPGMYPEIAERIGMFDRHDDRPEPTIEDYCDPHPYDGDDSDGGRCYCGSKRYVAGGAELEDPFR